MVMIVYPKEWREVGQKVTLKKIEETILTVLSEINCNCLSLSGGIDSSLLLYFMTQIFGKNIRCFTIACNEDHPDYVFANLVSRFFGIDNEIYTPSLESLDNNVVKEFYKHLNFRAVSQIITGDGVDELNCGYYAHLNDPSERTYYDFIWKLQKEHLEPLNKKSKNIEVCLPYIDKRLILLFSQIPVFEKVDNTERKKIIIQLAKGKIPDEIIYRRKYGFPDATRIKK